MIEMHIDVKSEPLKSILAKAPAEISSILNTEMSNWALRTANKAKGRAPYRTGNLAQSIMAHKSEMSAVAGAYVDYAKYVEPEPLGVKMTRNMTRTQYLYNSAMEEMDKMFDNIGKKIEKLFGGSL